MIHRNEFIGHKMQLNEARTVLMQAIEERVRDTRGGGRGGSFPGSTDEPKFVIALRAGPVREFSNELIRLSKARMWAVRFAETSSPTKAGYFEVLANPGLGGQHKRPLWTLHNVRFAASPPRPFRQNPDSH